jgi:hypothetical protein
LRKDQEDEIAYKFKASSLGRSQREEGKRAEHAQKSMLRSETKQQNYYQAIQANFRPKPKRNQILNNLTG